MGDEGEEVDSDAQLAKVNSGAFPDPTPPSSALNRTRETSCFFAFLVESTRSLKVCSEVYKCAELYAVPRCQCVSSPPMHLQHAMTSYSSSSSRAGRAGEDGLLLSSER